MKTEQIFKVKDDDKCACINCTDKTVHMLEKGAMVEIIHEDENKKTAGLVTGIGDKSIRLYTYFNPSYIIHYDEITEIRTIISSADMIAVSATMDRAANAYGIKEFLQKLLA